MHFLTTKKVRRTNNEPASHRVTAPSLFSHCGNPQCATGWMQLWRSRRSPVFEGHWACSQACMGTMVNSAVQREQSAGGSEWSGRGMRMPLGLTLIEQGQLTPEQLRAALAERARAVAETGEPLRLGEWLADSGILSESVITQALGTQWNCPTFSLDACRPQGAMSAIPHFLAESLAALPLPSAGGRHLYLGFAGRVDRSLTYAAGRILGIPVTAGVVRDSEFRRAQASFFTEPAPPVRFLEAGTVDALARSLTKLIEREKPRDVRLARVHGVYWLRTWKTGRREKALPSPGDVADILGTVGQSFATFQ
jgi:hypothetical protein